MYAAGLAYGADATRTPQWFLYSDTPANVAAGTAVAVVELTRFITSARQAAAEASLSLTWHDELIGAQQPKVGQILELRLEGTSYWLGIVQAINDFRISSGERTMSLSARTRDATPAWRQTRRATIIYPVGTPLSYIASAVAACVGVTPAENLLPDAGLTTVQSNVQLADLTAWDMLTQMYQPAGLEPFIDCRGRLKAISRDFGRPSDIVLADSTRLVKVAGGKSRPAVTEVRVTWIDPNLSESTQQARMLAQESITAGFFQLEQRKDVYFSSDQTQRARNTYLVKKKSANSGLIPFCTERYDQVSDTAGRISVETSFFAPALAGASLYELLALSYVPDGVSAGSTVPIGRVEQQAAQCAMMLIMMCLGTGMYEVWGTPFDYVHAKNVSTAYNQNASVWEINPMEIENDLVMNEAGAKAFAVRELAYAYRSASSYNITIVDDTRVEPGDIVELSDGSRVYVTDYSRDLSSGAQAVLDITGFRV